jgi:hypothetical protein
MPETLHCSSTAAVDEAVDVSIRLASRTQAFPETSMASSQ